MNSRRFAHVALVVVVAIAIGIVGCLWEAMAVARFEGIEHRSLGLFQTARGDYYRQWGVEVPLTVTVIAIAVYAVMVTYRTRHRADPLLLAAVWAASALAAVGVWYYSAIVGMNAAGVVM